VIKFKKAKSVQNTFLQGYIEVPYEKLVKVFGPPEEGDGYKTQVEWRIEFEDGTIATIYDYKMSKEYLGPDEGLEPEEITEWHIGGREPQAVILVYTAIFGKSETIKKIFEEKIATFNLIGECKWIQAYPGL